MNAPGVLESLEAYQHAIGQARKAERQAKFWEGFLSGYLAAIGTVGLISTVPFWLVMIGG